MGRSILCRKSVNPFNQLTLKACNVVVTFKSGHCDQSKETSSAVFFVKTDAIYYSVYLQKIGIFNPGQCAINTE